MPIILLAVILCQWEEGLHTMRKYYSNNNNNYYCLMATFFNSTTTTMNLYVRDEGYVVGVWLSQKLMISHWSRYHYISEETNLSLWIVNNYVGGSESHIYLMVGHSDVTPVCGLEVYITSKQYDGYPRHMIACVRKLRVYTQKYYWFYENFRHFIVRAKNCFTFKLGKTASLFYTYKDICSINNINFTMHKGLIPSL